jgi:WD40 repeat protein/serine/threonine protein kinase
VPDDSGDRDALLSRLADEFAARYRRGERPTLREYEDRYPELAEDIRDLFPTLVEMEQVRQDQGEAASPAATPLPPLQQLGDFRVLREIGRGGMGIVYEAEQLSLGRHVALKVLPQKTLLDPTQKRRFEREAKSAAKLHHTNIVPVFAVGEHDDLPYYAMQFIQGLGLDLVIEELQRMKAGGPAEREPRREVSAAQMAHSLLGGGIAATVDATEERPQAADARSAAALSSPSVSLPGQSGTDPSSRSGKATYWKSVAQVGIQVAEALAYAHEQGILHRDIKPSNLLLDTHGTVWVTDFGLAKADDQQNLTHRGDIIGTLRYMPPEAFDAKNEPRSDIYSLGLTLYEMLALRPAFDAADRNQLVRQITDGGRAPLDRVDRSIPRDLVTIVHKAMDREPAHRYAAARDLAADLRRFCADESILARRPTGRERVLRWARHHPGVAASLVLIALLLVAATVGSSIAALRFKQLAKDEESARQQAEDVGSQERWERYRANMAAASSALWTQNATAAGRYLDAAPEDHRNWEWRHLHSQLDGARAVLHGDNWPVHTLRFSSDGRWLASASQDGPIRLWDVASGREVGVLGSKTGGDTNITFCPTRSLLAAAYWEKNQGLVRVWDTVGRCEVAVFRTPGEYCQALAWSPDGRLLAAHISPEDSEKDGRMLVWELPTGAVIADAPADIMDASLDFRPGTSQLVRRYRATPWVWDLKAATEVSRFERAKAPCACLSYSQDGRRLAVGYREPDSSVRLWDVATGQRIAAMGGHTNTVEKVVFSPDGTRLASCSMDQTVRLWNGITGQAVAVLRGHTGEVRRGGFTPDGKYFVSASHDRTLRMWNSANGELVTVLRGHDGRVTDMAISPDGRTIASASDDHTIRLWDTELAARNGVLQGHGSYVYDVAIRPDGGQIASASWDGTVRLWDPTTGRQTHMFRLPDGDNKVGCVAYHPDGHRLVSVSRMRRITIWNLTTGTPLHEIEAPTGGWTGDSRAAFNPQGNLLAVGSAADNVRLFDPDSGALVAVLAIFPQGTDETVGNVRDVAFSPDGTLLAISAYDKTVHIWDVSTRTERHILSGHTDRVNAVAFTADGHLLASADRLGNVRLWDTSTYQGPASLPHRGSVYGMAFTPDGTRLATACIDNAIHLWDVATRQEVAELRGHSGYVHAVAFSPDGTRLISGSGDATVRIWDTLPPAARSLPRR